MGNPPGIFPLHLLSKQWLRSHPVGSRQGGKTCTQGDFGASRLQGGGSSALGESSGVLAPWSMKTMQPQFF